MKAQMVLSYILLSIGLVGFSATLTLGLINKFGVEMIGLLVFFFVVSIVGLVYVVKNHEEPEVNNVGLSCWHGGV